jgi:hypothetical protein
MATILSTPTTVTVVATPTPGTSALGNLAASMPVGSWARLAPANDQNAFLGVGSVSGSMIHYCNSMPWNSAARCIEILGCDHNYGSVRYVRYDEATNQFLLVSNDIGLGTATQHGYDHWTINPNTHDIYHRKATYNSGTISCFRLTPGTTRLTALPGVPASIGAEQIAIGACWWSGSFTGGGAQGSLMVYNSGNAVGNTKDGQIVAFNPLTNSWFFNRDSMAPNSFGTGNTYHSVIEYSDSKNVAVYGGGGGSPGKVWRLNPDQSSIAMPDAPPGKEVGIQHGLFCADPVSGNFLLLSAGELWELNPAGTGTWTRQTGSRVPPAAVGIPGPNPAYTPDGMICCPIPDHGVIAYIKQTSPANGAFFLYKHA